MNWRLSALDNITLISNSDAHSLEKLGREANVLDAELSYEGLFNTIKNRKDRQKLKTLEFFPEEGKYHVDGHRSCKTRLQPKETRQRKGLCPVCEKPVTVGVLHRVEKLADQPLGRKPSSGNDFENLIALKKVLGETLQVGPVSVKVDRLYHELLTEFGSELSILRELPLERLQENYPLVMLALARMRQGKVQIQPGYDGEYGKISLLKEKDLSPSAQLTLL